MLKRVLVVMMALTFVSACGAPNDDKAPMDEAPINDNNGQNDDMNLNWDDNNNGNNNNGNNNNGNNNNNNNDNLNRDQMNDNDGQDILDDDNDNDR